MATLATGYIALVPEMQGSHAAITSAILPEATKAGDQAGSAIGKGVLGKAKGLLTVAAVGGAFKGLYEVGNIFDEVTDTIRVGTGATGEALDGLVGVAKNVGKNVPAEFSAIAPVVADLNTRLGLSGDTLETVASQYLEAGRILGEDVDINATSKAFSVFALEGESVSGAMDHLFRVSQATGVGINQLATSTATAAPAAQQLGWGFEETASMIGVFDKAGLNSQKMMMGLGAGLVQMAKDGESPAEVFPRLVDELGGLIESGDDAAAIDLAAGIFGTKAAPQFLQAIKDGTLSLSDLGNVAGMTGDTILGVGADTGDFAESWQLVKNNALLALEPLGSGVFNALGSALQGVLPYMQQFGAWLGENQGVIAAVAGVIGVTLVAAFITWTASIWAATGALLANPITWAVVGIVALIAAIVLLWQNWDQVTAWVTNVWGTFIAWVQSVGDSFKSWWDGLWAAVGDFIKNKWTDFTTWVSTKFTAMGDGLRGIGDGIKSWWTGLWGAVRDKIKEIWTAYTTWVVTKFTSLYTGIKGVGDRIKSWWSGLWGGVKDFIRNAWDGIKDIAKSGVDKLVGFFKGIPSGISGALSDIAGKVTAPFKNAFNGIARLWNGTVGKLSWSVPSWVPAIGGKTISVPKLPQLATGGTALAPGWAVVGEVGPELLHMPRGASVVPLDHPASAGAFGEGDGDPRAVIAQFTDDQMRALAAAVQAAVLAGFTGSRSSLLATGRSM